MQPLSRADLHIHTTCSDGHMTPEEVVEWAARKTDLRLIAITDHDTIEGALIAKAYRDRHIDRFGHLEVVVGAEVMAADADVLGLFLAHDIPPGLPTSEAIARIHEQGGIAIAAHPFTFLTAMMSGMKGAGMRIRHLPFDAVEVQHASPTEVFSNQIARAVNRRGQRLPETGGSDAHFLSSIGSAYTLFPGHTAADLRRAFKNGAVVPGGSYYSPLTLVRTAARMLSARLRRWRKVPANT